MLSLLAQIAPFAIGMMLTPTLFGLQVLVVSGPRWHGRAWAVLTGSGLVFAAVIGLGLRGFSQLPSAGSGSRSTVEYVLEGAIGALLIAVAAWMVRARKRGADHLQARVQGYAERAGWPVFLGLAVYMSATDFSTFALMLPALHDVTNSAQGLVVKGFAVVLLYAAALAPVFGPLVAVLVGGDTARQRLNRAYTVVMAHQVQIMGVVLAVVGLILVWRGASGIAAGG